MTFISHDLPSLAFDSEYLINTVLPWRPGCIVGAVLAGAGLEVSGVRGRGAIRARRPEWNLLRKFLRHIPLTRENKAEAYAISVSYLVA